MNDRVRAAWVDNDEGLYWWWRGSGKTKLQFVADHREELTNHINQSLFKTTTPNQQQRKRLAGV